MVFAMDIILNTTGEREDVSNTASGYNIISLALSYLRWRHEREPKRGPDPRWLAHIGNKHKVVSYAYFQHLRCDFC